MDKVETFFCEESMAYLAELRSLLEVRSRRTLPVLMSSTLGPAPSSAIFTPVR